MITEAPGPERLSSSLRLHYSGLENATSGVNNGLLGMNQARVRSRALQRLEISGTGAEPHLQIPKNEHFAVSHGEQKQ